MNDIQFIPWPKITRDNPFNCTITEKIDGTNACIVIQDGKIVACQSRKRFITPEDDNAGFASWVQENTEDLLKLGDGHHYGEWAGEKIQNNPHKLEGKQLFLFNTKRWGLHNPNTPDCCNVVPVLYEGVVTEARIKHILTKLEEEAVEFGEDPEGIVCYWHTFGTYTKHTIKSPNGKWCK